MIKTMYTPIDTVTWVHIKLETILMNIVWNQTLIKYRPGCMIKTMLRVRNRDMNVYFELKKVVMNINTIRNTQLAKLI